MTDDDVTKTPPTPCPSCGKKLDATTNVRDDSCRPNPGDISVCVGCMALLMFAEDMRPRWLTRAEYEALPPEAFAAIYQNRFAISRVMHTPLGCAGDRFAGVLCIRDVDGLMAFECGCQLGAQDDVFLHVACRAGTLCPVVEGVMRRARELGKPRIVVGAPDPRGN